MTLKEMKMKVLGLIEELNKDSEFLTEDPDIATKMNDVINQILFELARIKKIPKYFEMEVHEGDVLDFADFEKECGYEVFQIYNIAGVQYDSKAYGTIYKMLEDGKAEIDLFVYPERITDKTKDNYEFELSADALEIMPYGIAADLLKADVSTDYGREYALRYADMKANLDPRYALPMITIEGGVEV